MNPETEFDIRIEPIAAIWEGLRIQVLVVRCGLDGQTPNQFACVVYQGTVKTLGASIGGYGLMSGLAQGQSFYFTYSWGSGVHRSHAGKLQIVNGAVQLWDSGGFLNVDLFLSRRPNGDVAVESGKFESFNGWGQPAEYARIDESDPSNTKLVALDGSVLAIFTPVTP